ncbi:hypothetical protein GCM10023211_11490 [Orbus sasakiae]|uniref:Uncharacterized protein n=1 Tax=Orbus sasakiae TaxID=1078475 RepID=A0ABP9N924_9GAMM
MNNPTVYFLQLLAKYPDYRILRYNTFNIGYKDSDSIRYNTICNDFPTPDTKAFRFCDMGEVEYVIFCAFLNSLFAQTIETLSIGWTSNFHDCKKPTATEEWCFDITRAVERLGQTKLPNLKSLALGEYYLLCNAHEVYGRLGDVTQVLQQNSHIEVLELSGVFELQHPISFKQLKNFTLCFEDPIIQMSFGGISNQTWQNIMNSDMPSLIEADISLVFENAPDFTFNERFLNKETFPKLERLYFSSSLTDDEWKKIEQSKLAQTTELFIEKIR